MKGKCLSFNLVQSLVVYDKKQLRYDRFRRYIPILENIALQVTMATMHFHRAQTGLFMGKLFFSIQGVQGINLAPVQNCLWVQGRSN